ncbi:hypothetical protein K501DRAFT_271600 [Backusella circina FSU 941]|nr:hypothetical protein K501DRAFT_271600 [Backusella circina FSU 941]
MMEVEANLKEKRKADSVAYNFLVEPKMRQTTINHWDKAVVSGLDSRGVSTEVLMSSKLESLHEESDVQSGTSIGEPKRHEWTLNLTANQANRVNFFKKHTRSREKKKIRKKNDINRKKQEREAVTRKIRTNKFHQKLYSSYHAADRETAKVPVSNFIGSWNRITTGMKGHTRIKLKPLLDRMKSIRHDSTLVVDEHNTTVTCSSCFGPT